MSGITFDSGSRCLKGAAYGPDIFPSAAVIFIHGLGSSQAGYTSRAKATSEALGVRCFTFDLSGHGEDAANFSRYSVYDHLDDVIAVYDYVARQDKADPARIGVCAASYGAYLAALLSSRRPVKRLLLRAPALASDINLPSPRPQEGESEAFDSLAALARYTGQVLILESGQDCRIPHSNIVAYLSACPSAEHSVIPDAKHALTEPAWNAEFIRDIVRWFSEL